MNLANFDGDDSYNESLSKGYLKKTQLVGSYLPNGWGLNDMHGNVLEWCSDWYDNYSKGFQSNPLGKSYGLDRVIRGGGWFSTARFCRSSFRNHNNPSYSYHTLGFRLVAP
jgi:formylglycine-generating enzyme required for sulfatase activity